MANLSSKAAQSYHAASSVCKELINLAAADPRGVRVVSCEVSDVYSFLGSKSRLVDPVLHGDHATVCCVGSSALGLQLLVDVFRAAASDMMSGARKIASERLLRLGVSLLECHEDSGLSWKDAISEKAIDPFMLDDNAFVCTSQPLQQHLEVVEECIQRKAAAASSSSAGSPHFAFELSAAHANEMGALTVVFLPLPATAVEPLESQSLDSLWQYASTLRSVGEVFGKPRTGFGLQPAHHSRNGLILMLMPKNIGGEQSLASHLAAECAKLVEDAAMGSEKEVRKMSVIPALAAYKMQPPTSNVVGWGVLDGADLSEAAGSGATEAAQIPSTQQSQPPQPSQSSYVPVTPRASISVWQKIAELDSFDVEAWCRDMQQHGRSSSDQITELSKIVTQFQDLLRFLASQVLPGNHGHHPGASSSFGSHSLRETNGEILRESRDSMVSPRLGASPYTTSARQVLPAHGTHTLASTGNLVALSPRNPTERRGESLSSSPLTRSCSANYPVGSVLPQKGNSWSGLREVQSPKTVTRDLSPAELRMLNATPQPQPHPGVQGHAAQPSWQSTLMSVPSTALLAQLQSAPQDGHIMRSPRTEQGRERGDGQRSPLPRPPQFAKAHPHSARAAPSGMIFAPGQPVPRPHPMRSAEMTGGLRWEPSPFRVRFMSASQPQVQLAPSSAGAMGNSAPPGRLGAQVMPHSHHVAVGHHVGDLRPSPVMSPAKIV